VAAAGTGTLPDPPGENPQLIEPRLQTIPRLFAAGGFFLPVGQGASAGWRFVVWSNPLIELVLDVPRGHTCRSTASVRTGPAHFRTRGGCSYGAVMPWEGRARAGPQRGVQRSGAAPYAPGTERVGWGRSTATERTGPARCPNRETAFTPGAVALSG